MTNKLDISVIILTHNEEIHLRRCLENISTFADQVYIVDSFSDDSTVSIAHEFGVTVKQNPWVNYSTQFKWALDNFDISTEWVMRLDADEILTTELIDELTDNLPNIADDIKGLSIKRRHYFLGKWIKYGDRYPLILLRLWRNRCAHIEERWMDEHIVLDQGRSVTLENDFIDDNRNTIAWFIDKHNKYASREMVDILNQKYHFYETDRSLDSDDTKQAKLKRYIKENIYNKLPIFVRPFLYFLYRYFIRLGFLDGKEGFAYHFMQGFWYRCLVDLKCLEAERLISDDMDNATKRACLSKLTGLNLS